MAFGMSVAITPLAMTKVFTPPSSCSSSWTYEPEAANDIESGLLIQNAAPSDSADPSCFPSGFNHYGRHTADTPFSPGYCPIGYTSADVTISQSTTTAVCCLLDYSYTTMTMENGNAIYAGCTRMFSSTSSTTVTIRESKDKTTQVIGPITMWAQPITIELHSSDLSLFVSTTTTSMESSTSPTPSTSASSTLASSTSSMTSPQPQTFESKGLSTGAGIGVCVGVGVGGLAMLVAIGLWFFHRRRPDRNLTGINAPRDAYTYPPIIKANIPQASQEMYAHGVNNYHHELHGSIPSANIRPIYPQ